MSLPYSPGKAVFHGNGATTAFPFSFKVWAASQVAASVIDPHGVTTPAVGCSVATAPSGSGGTVTYLHQGAPLPAGWRLVLLRDMPFAQNVDLLSGTRFDPQVIEDQLDQATAERQQLKEAVDRAVKLPAASDLTPEEYGRDLLDARDQAQDSAQQAAQSARKAEHALAETIVAGQSAIREIREETDIQKDRLQAVADTAIVTVGREADRAHDEADRAEREADRAAVTATLAVRAHNLEATWTLAEDIPAGGLLTLPDGVAYFPGRGMLRLGFEGLACYAGTHFEEVAFTRVVECPVEEAKACGGLLAPHAPSAGHDALHPIGGTAGLTGPEEATPIEVFRKGGSGEGEPPSHFERSENGCHLYDQKGFPSPASSAPCAAGKSEAFPDLPSDTVRLLFDAAKGTVFNAWVVASNVAKHVEEAEEKAEQARDEAQAHADRACECAELSCECADEAEKAKDTAVNAAQDAQDSADRADDAATDAEKAAQAALAAHCHLGIASVLEAGVFSKPLPHGFYTLNPHIVLPATCSLPLYPVEDGEHILSGVEGFYLFAPRDPDCDPNNPGGTPGTPGGDLLPCGRRDSLL